VRSKQLTSDTPLVQAIAACKRHFVSAAVFSALLNLLYLTPTLYMLQVYDRVVPTRGGLTLLFLTGVLLLALGSLSMLDMVRSRLLVRASMRLDRLLTSAILDATLARPARSRDNLTKQAVREFDTLRQSLTGVGILAAFDAPWTPIYLLVCFLISPWLGVLGTVGALALLAVTWRNENATREPLQRANQAANASYVSQEYSTASADVVRALGMRTAMVKRHVAERELSTRLQSEASFAASGYLTMTRFIRLSLQSLALGLGAFLAIENKISAGAIFAASILVSRALAPIEQVLGAWKSIIQARGAYRTLTELFERGPPDISMTQLPPPQGQVEAERLVVFTPTRDAVILRDINFKVAAGELVGIIGPSGAGKSTLARTIAGAQLPDQGAVRFDGADGKDWDSERLARHIGFMPQDATLFAGTIKENIARFRNFLGENPEKIDEMVVEAAQRCGAHDMILRLPNGYDTILGLGGRGLSAGQAQRIALARSLFGSPSLLVLDEPNAHLDSDGEATLVTTLLELKKAGTTVLIIAHRTGVLSAIDKLMVLRDGRIDLYGQRDEVLQRLNAPHLRLAPNPAQGAPASQATS
jgi:PrtD family type I secretion system ABC transporter